MSGQQSVPWLNMAIQTKEIVAYGAIAIVVLVAVWVYASSNLNTSYSVSVLLSPVSPMQNYYPFQTEEFRMLINNTGRSQLSDLTVVFYADNVTEHTYSVTLPPGTGSSIYINFTYPINGTYTFSAVADPAGLVQLQDRYTSRSSVSVNVSAAQSPDVYTSIPNSGTIGTQSFSLTTLGIAAALFLESDYNITEFSRMFGGGDRVVPGIFTDLYSYITDANGAFSTYGNSSYAYVAWLQGSVNPSIVYPVVSSFRVPISNISVSGSRVSYARLSNSTSLCVFYQGGWTKLVEYGNVSGGPTCAGLIYRSYAPNESTFFVGELKSNPSLGTYMSRFHYGNATEIGSALVYSGNDLSAIDISNTTAGFFGGVIKLNKPPIDLASANSTCLGLTYSYNGFAMCSTYIFSRGGTINVPFALLNSSVVTPNYTASLYSLVNTTLIVTAHEKAIQLLGYLDLGGPYLAWTFPFKESCSFANATFGCKVSSYNSTTHTLTLNITNGYGSQVRLNGIGCSLGAIYSNQTENVTITGGASAAVDTYCSYLGFPGLSAQTTYILALNYTLNGAVHHAAGFANVTNIVT